MADPSIDAGPGVAAPGVAAYEAGDYARAHDLLKPAADAGDLQARYLMARLLSGDISTMTDYGRARSFLDKRVRCHTPDALNLYGYLLAPNGGQASYQTYLKQARIYKEAAAAGSHKALFNLGLITIRHLKKHVIGGAYMLDAAERGDIDAKSILDKVVQRDWGDKALLLAQEKAREEPFDVRWPSLANLSSQCKRFNAYR
ncbi:sel1 repeat family protein [Marivibrio halodurans]|uniref:Sel1 repeat family protein n=1 Tax=Marivibrio halodurans TaxID=2039722 RepID=A0A8J7S369_9PROT|nr:sel1 repeat family protein [Marivibrio halodurans]MBP5855849.1 sel1 repeat family protein [Marivibrio halodurans]